MEFKIRVLFAEMIKDYKNFDLIIELTINFSRGKNKRNF